jgi:hypothetical protein
VKKEARSEFPNYTRGYLGQKNECKAVFGTLTGAFGLPALTKKQIFSFCSLPKIHRIKNQPHT